MAEDGSEGVVVAVGVGEQARGGKVEVAGDGVDVAVVGYYVDDVGQKHVVAPETADTGYAALYGEGGLLYQRGAHFEAGQRRESGVTEFVVVGSGADTGPVCGAGHGFSGQIEGKLHLPLYDGVAVALGTDGDVAHRGIGADGACPGYRKHVPFLRLRSAGHKGGGSGIDHCTRFPAYFSHGTESLEDDGVSADFVVAIVAAQCGRGRIYHVEAGAYGLVVGHAFGIGATYQIHNLGGETDGLLADHGVVFNNVDHGSGSYDGYAIEHFGGEDGVGDLNNAFGAEMARRQVGADGHGLVAVFKAEQAHGFEEGAGRDMVYDGAGTQGGDGEFFLLAHRVVLFFSSSTLIPRHLHIMA